MRISLRWQVWTQCGDIDGKKNYGTYSWTAGEIFWEMCKAGGIVFLFSWFFYRSVWAAPLMCVLAVLYMRQGRGNKIERCRKQLVLQFQECIQAVSASLQAGYSVENAFMESESDMKMMFGENSYISYELSWIHRGLVMNITLEELLADLGRRSRAEEIQEFAEVFAIAKRNGGNIPEVISASEEVIRRRSETEEEIRTQMAARSFEQKVMNVMPFAILIYIQSSSPGYFNALYHNVTGVLIMTGCLAVYLFACGLSERILTRSAAVWG